MRNRFSAGVLLASAAASAVSLPAMGNTLTWDTSTAANIQPASGTWNFNTNADWSSSSAGSNPLLTWTSNTDTASFVMPGGANTVTLDGTNGQLGAAGLQLTGAGGANTLTLTGSSLQLGAGGIVSTMSNQVVAISAPLALTASQTWTSTSLRTNSNGPSILVTGAVSSLSGITNLIFDGQGLSNAASTSGANTRVTFSLGGVNTFSGTTTVTGGASLWLDYTANAGSRLDDSRALILAGGSILLSGGSGIVETVGSTTINAGANSIFTGGAGSGGALNTIHLGALTHNLGGTFDVSNAQLTVATTSTTLTDSMIGGWMTCGGSRWASVDANGAFITYTGSSTTLGAAASTTNVAINAATSGTDSTLTADKTVNSLRITNGAVTVDLNTHTLTLTSGGILGGAANGQVISDGAITSTYQSGVGAPSELFIHTPVTLTVSAVVANATGLTTALVKDGVSSATLTNTNTYTGGTYVNSGTLTLDNGGSLANSNIHLSGGTLNAGTTGAGGTLNFKIANDTADLIDITGGTFDLTNIKLNLVLSGTQTLSEYVIADKAVGSAYVTGTTFAPATVVPGGWTIDYTGTTDHPGDIVLAAVPEPSSLALIGLAGAGLSARRRRMR